MSPTNDAWPPLPLAEWRDTYQALHMRTQIVGKTRLALAPMENHWWNVALYPTARGLTTAPMTSAGRTLEVELDLWGDAVVVRTTEGVTRSLRLSAGSVADFYRAYRALLHDELGIEAHIWPVPVELPEAVPFLEQDLSTNYSAEHARRWWLALLQGTRVFEVFRGRFVGKCSPVHFWWGGFDLACTRFNGERAPEHPGGVPHFPDWAVREAYSHACISAGWWPGTPGIIDEPAFYSYAYPEPPGFPEAKVQPAAARYDTTLREWLLPYDAVLTAEDPDRALRDFLQTTYEAAATLASWDRAALER
jgi:hypothetical protein